jgi:hypothetical protein
VVHYNNVYLLNDSSFLARKNTGIKNTRHIKTKVKTKVFRRIISFEDANLEGNFPKIGSKILILRDAFNMFASRIKNGPLFCKAIDSAIWRKHAAEFVGETSFLGKDAVKINYNKWFSDVSYRKELAERYFGGFIRDNVNKVSHIGSSFDGFGFQGHAQDMNVLGRYKAMSGNRIFKRKIGQKIILYCEKIFGMKLGD